MTKLNANMEKVNAKKIELRDNLDKQIKEVQGLFVDRSLQNQEEKDRVLEDAII